MRCSAFKGHPCGHLHKELKMRSQVEKSTGARDSRVKHGNYTKESIALRRLVAQIVSDSAELLADIDDKSVFDLVM